MLNEFFQRIDHWSRCLLPMALAALLVIGSIVPIRLSGFATVAPWLPLIVVFYWTAHRPDLMPPLSVFLLGILADLVGGGPIGPSALALLLVHAAVKSQRRHILPHPFMIQWAIFALTAPFAEVLLWICYSIAYRDLVPIEQALFQALMTIAIYPCIAWVFVQTQRAFLQRG